MIPKKVSTFSIQIDIIQERDITDICSIMFKYVRESVKESLISLVSLKSSTALGKYVSDRCRCSQMKHCFKKLRKVFNYGIAKASCRPFDHRFLDR
jgi:hypothetical protein